MDIIGIERQAQDMILGKEIQMSLMLWAVFWLWDVFQGWGFQRKHRDTVLAKQRIETQLAEYENRRGMRSIGNARQ